MARRLIKLAPPPKTDRPDPLLYSVPDACILLGNISKQMLYRLIQLGMLHPVKIGSRSMFTMEELKRFVRDSSEQDEAVE